MTQFASVQPATVVDVVVTRDGQRWVADVPSLAGLSTCARTLPGLDQAVRDAIMVSQGLADADADSVNLHFEFQLEIGTHSSR